MEESGRPDLATRAGRRLGLSVQEIDRDLAEFLGARAVAGVLVASVVPGGTAGAAGLRRGDVLKEINGRPTPSLAAFRTACETIDGEARFAVWRDGADLTLVRP